MTQFHKLAPLSSGAKHKALAFPHLAEPDITAHNTKKGLV